MFCVFQFSGKNINFWPSYLNFRVFFKGHFCPNLEKFCLPKILSAKFLSDKVFWDSTFYLKCTNFRVYKFSRISRILAKYAKLNTREKFFKSGFAKINTREKKLKVSNFTRNFTHILNWVLGGFHLLRGEGG